MLGISEDEILETFIGYVPSVRDHHPEAAIIVLVEPDPHDFILDIVRTIAIEGESEGIYRIDTDGFVPGSIRVTREGVAELGESLLTDRSEIPEWILAVPRDPEQFPWWVPDSYTGEPSVACERCGTETPVSTIVVPEAEIESRPNRFCPDCWDEVRQGWWDRHPGEDGPQDAWPNADDDPENSIRRSEEQTDIRNRIASGDPNVQRAALESLVQFYETRPQDVLEILPDLVTTVESEDADVREHTLEFIASFAADFPDQSTSLADAVIRQMDVDSSRAESDHSVRFLRNIAAAAPEAVVDAVPTLSALLQDGRASEEDLVVIMVNIAKGYPEAMLPVTADLVDVINQAGRPKSYGLLAALGYVAKEYPHVAEATVPTLLTLLDDPNDKLRANAAAILADLANEYPDEVRPAVPRVIELLDDVDDHARYNATSILARVAKPYPADVEPAIDDLIGALDQGNSLARENACWALGYLGANSASARLSEVEESDPEQDVREVASWALDQI